MCTALGADLSEKWPGVGRCCQSNRLHSTAWLVSAQSRSNVSQVSWQCSAPWRKFSMHACNPRVLLSSVKIFRHDTGFRYARELACFSFLYSLHCTIAWQRCFADVLWATPTHQPQTLRVTNSAILRLGQIVCFHTCLSVLSSSEHL